MRSENPFRRSWRLLADNDSGIVLALSVALLLAAGSLVRNAWPEAYEGLSGDDFTFFFRRGFRLVDLWFWLLFLALSLLGLSLFAVGTDTAWRRIRRGVRDVREYGPPLAHWGAALALLAHFLGGIAGEQAVAMAPRGLPVPLGPLRVRLAGLDTEAWPDGTARRWDALVDVITPDGRETRRQTAPNAPATWDLGREMLLVMRVVDGVPAFSLDVDGAPHDLAAGPLAGHPGESITIDRVFGPPEFQSPVVQLRIEGGPREGRWLVVPHGPAPPGIALSMRLGEGVLLSWRRAPGTPILLVASLLVALGTLLSAGRYLRHHRTR